MPAVSGAISVLAVLTEIGFVVLAVAVLVDWLQRPDPRRGYLALAFGSLAILTLIAPALSQPSPYSELATDAALILFLTSGYALLRFRDSFIPLKRRDLQAVTALLAIVLLGALAARLPAQPEAPHSLFQDLVLAAVLTTWVLCVVEPVLTLWSASRGRPAVEGARMRALGLGYAALIAVVIVDTLGGAEAQGDALQLTLRLITLAIVPVLLFSFYPPVWLRRLWSQPEEEGLRQGLHDLLTYSPNRATQAQRALAWATRLVGAAGAFIVEPDGSILAARGMTTEEARAIAEHQVPTTPRGSRRPAAGSQTTLVIPLQMHSGEGWMVMLAGPFTPLFGDDEIKRLQQYAGSIAAGLDRVSLSQKIASLEQAKTEFLNVASHELRGPMTVIKGYLTMIDGGSMGDASPQLMSVLPLLIAKADEVDSMIEQMIEVARLEDGRLALHKERCNIVELTEQAIRGITPLLANHALHVEKPAQEIDAEVDPERFQIVVRNLVSNAAKYSADREPIEVAVSHHAGQATVAVTDHGIGIDEHDQQRLFTRFGRIESSDAKHVRGTGLGLWLSREIARMHQGDITVESRRGRGSTFRFLVPSAE
jgi:signal transduction histidine kinase